MQRSRKRWAALAVLLTIAFVAYAVWVYVDGIRSRFPDLDLENATVGVASWYSETDPYINKHTANGEVFDDSEHTCASWDFPFHQRLLIINAWTGRYIDCRVNDRGPAKRLNRKIDLTKATFSQIANIDRGLIHVFILPIQEGAEVTRPA